jgi:hypothetical protein
MTGLELMSHGKEFIGMLNFFHFTSAGGALKIASVISRWSKK